jgi:hypothetical protein
VLAATLEGADVAGLRETMDKLKDKLKTAAIVLASVNDGKVSLIAGVTADSTGKVKAGELVNFVAQQVGGKGGGRPDMAQAGGTDPAAWPARWPVFRPGSASAYKAERRCSSVYAACVTHAGRCRSWQAVVSFQFRCKLATHNELFWCSASSFRKGVV